MNTVKLDEEFVNLLTNKDRPELRGITIQCVLDMTDTNEGIQTLSRNEPSLNAIFHCCLEDDQPSFVKYAYKTLINLSAVDSVSWKILQLQNSSDLIMRLFRVALDSESSDSDLACKLLSNVTRFEKCAAKVFKIVDENSDSIGFDKIINAFCTKGYNSKGESLDYLGCILANLTQIKETRKYILDEERCVIQRILVFISFLDSKIRRRGAITLIKNCCFEIDYHEWLLSEKVDILPYLLLPLAGGEEYDEDDMDRLPLDLQYLPPEKQREPELELRLLLIEAILKMCATKPARQFIKSKNTYVIVRDLDNWETDESIKKSIHDLIQILIGDEPSEEHSNLQEVEIPEDIQKQFEEDAK
ncbi:protein HGH1 homolog [Tubulanus polymorphus]|uniref:protein HGH1 homolog n=1 Tax=Tubulanus polymorphus TaxID=672921 RepID=UPI003DA5FC21